MIQKETSSKETSLHRRRLQKAVSVKILRNQNPRTGRPTNIIRPGELSDTIGIRSVVYSSPEAKREKTDQEEVIDLTDSPENLVATPDWAPVYCSRALQTE